MIESPGVQVVRLCTPANMDDAREQCHVFAEAL